MVKGLGSWGGLEQPWSGCWAGPVREGGKGCVLPTESGQVNVLGGKIETLPVFACTQID